MQRRIEFDLEYLRYWSPTLDLRILFQTVVQVFFDGWDSEQARQRLKPG
jgi:lipopolysaccharide/colanic/teichoic acid biosynthesis glycosyltransferase